MTIRISHSHFVHAAFMSSLVCQTFDQMMYCIWKNEFSWNKVVRGDSTGPTNGTRSQKVWQWLPATMVRQCVQDAPRKIDEASPAATYKKAV